MFPLTLTETWGVLFLIGCSTLPLWTYWSTMFFSIMGTGIVATIVYIYNITPENVELHYR